MAHKTVSQDICFRSPQGYRQFTGTWRGPLAPGRNRGHGGPGAGDGGRRHGHRILLHGRPAKRPRDQRPRGPLYVVSVDAEEITGVVVVSGGEKKDLLASGLTGRDLQPPGDSWRTRRGEDPLSQEGLRPPARIIPEEGGLRIDFERPQESIYTRTGGGSLSGGRGCPPVAGVIEAGDP